MDVVQDQNIELTTELQQLITGEQARKYRMLPKAESESSLSFYVDNQQPVDELTSELEILFGQSVQLIPVSADAISEGISKYYRTTAGGQTSKKIDLRNASSDDFLEDLILEAKQFGSSDIHIEAYKERCRVRIRIDGDLVERYVISQEDYPALINKIKIKSNLDIAEKRLPQDGRIFFEQKGSKFDIRVSILPTLHGEKVVMRLLNNDATEIDIKSLGFSQDELKSYLEGIKKPNGIILISGPTGSGKTTTLYATLKLLNEEKRNVVTVEDPIEYTLEGINQVQVKDSIGLTFASALKSFLRQDPDVIMLGEIRDAETADMAIRAALTGHLVLSTIHTNSAWRTISRLIDMGVEPFLLASTINTTAAQRLVKVLCLECKEQKSLSSADYPPHFKPIKKLTQQFVAKGCESCFYSGYKGRKAVYEIIPINNSLSKAIKNNNFDISDELKEMGMRTLSQNAFDLFAEGVTSLDEVYPLLSSDN
jgi:type IV pilus assembly protein PilB